MTTAPPKTEYCLLEVRERVLIVTLNRPTSLNALHPMASDELAKVWDWYEQDGSLFVAIVTGKGRLFCAGFDLQWFAKNPQHQLAANIQTSGFGGLTRRRVKKPIIAAVNGPAFGGGFELALACDLIVAANSAQFALSEPAVGLAAVGGGLVRLPRLIGYQRALELILTAEPITAERAKELGIINDVVPTEEVMDRALLYAKRIAKNSPDSIIASKAVVNLSMNSGIEAAMDGQHALREVKGMLDGANRLEGIKAFNEKRKPKWLSSKL